MLYPLCYWVQLWYPRLKSEYNLMLYPLCYWVQLWYPQVEFRIQSDALSTKLLGPALIHPGWSQNTIWCSIHYATGSSSDTPGWSQNTIWCSINYATGSSSDTPRLNSEYNLMLYPLSYWVQLWYPQVEFRIQSDALSTKLLGPALIPPGWNQNTIWCSIH